MFILLFSFALTANAQYGRYSYITRIKDLRIPYEPFENFNNDTIAYLQHNFRKRAPQCYNGMSVGELIDLLPFNIIKVRNTYTLLAIGSTGPRYPCFGLYMIYEDTDSIGRIPRKKLSVNVRLKMPLNETEMARLKYESDSLREYIKDRIIEHAYVEPIEMHNIIMLIRKEESEKKHKLIQDANKCD